MNRPRPRIVVLAALAVLFLVSAAVGIYELLGRRNTVREVRALQDSVHAARVSADSCANELAYREMLFRTFHDRVDSIRRVVRDFEKLDPRGVPRERYEEYLRVFEIYNDSVADWERQAEALQAAEEVCRTLILRHNELADSFRARLEREGMIYRPTGPSAEASPPAETPSEAPPAAGGSAPEGPAPTPPAADSSG